MSPSANSHRKNLERAILLVGGRVRHLFKARRYVCFDLAPTRLPETDWVPLWSSQVANWVAPLV